MYEKYISSSPSQKKCQSISTNIVRPFWDFCWHTVHTTNPIKSYCPFKFYVLRNLQCPRSRCNSPIVFRFPDVCTKCRPTDNVWKLSLKKKMKNKFIRKTTLILGNVFVGTREKKMQNIVCSYRNIDEFFFLKENTIRLT